MTSRHNNRLKLPTLFRQFGDLNPFLEEFTIDEEREGSGLSVYEDIPKQLEKLVSRQCQRPVV